MGSQRGAFGQVYRVVGIRNAVSTCEWCGRGGLTTATVLEVYDEDGQPVGTKCACSECAAKVTG
jgi:hypothetical protein